MMLQDDMFAAPEPVCDWPPPTEPELVDEAEPVEYENHEQGALFDLEALDWWREHWVGMPDFIQEDMTPWKSIYVHFECRSDLDKFSRLIEQSMTERTRSVWFPEAEIGRMMDKRFADRTAV